MLVLFSEGIDFDVDATAPRISPNSTLAELEDPTMDRDTVLTLQRGMLAKASAANVHIYTIDPRGAGAFEQLLIHLVGVRPPTRELRDEVRRSTNTLRNFAGTTGGVAAVDTDKFDGVFARVIAESRTYYLTLSRTGATPREVPAARLWEAWPRSQTSSSRCLGRQLVSVAC